MRGLAGRTAIVTGAGSDIGAAIAQRLAQEGARVALADIADSKSVDATVAEVARTWESPNILVNNAGADVFDEPLSSTSEDWRRCMAVDLEGAWHCARAVLPKMLEARRGAIANIASNGGVTIRMYG